MTDRLPRCDWCLGDASYIDYHDQEWGRPVWDSQKLFENLCLEAFQAGLSWITILRKRENFRAAFAQFTPKTLAQWGEGEVTRLLQDEGIIRHRGKIEATLRNAKAYLTLEAEVGFAQFIWGFVDHSPQINRPRTLADVPAQTETSRALSKALKSAGFKFCGPTTVYAFMQASGLVNDHLQSCAFASKGTTP
ncbi:DNA-3-methyladenine glycosylase I [Rhodobacteraceae bacterium XHP0102]|nr:DNA-3-methyladenine glycosylase I [Rhodobacteraceae bacterium XHP0102]